jgi:hypothetical protein
MDVRLFQVRRGASIIRLGPRLCRPHLPGGEGSMDYGSTHTLDNAPRNMKTSMGITCFWTLVSRVS